ncbi:hypothetical protein RCL1_000554 [Eukaryota sp. TZLM3-RCL]
MQSIFVLLSLLTCVFCTTIDVFYPEHQIPFKTYVTIRGDGLGMTWDSGFLLEKVSRNHWQVNLTVTTPTALQFKILLNDTVWQKGSNEMVLLNPTSESVNVFPFFYSEKHSIETHCSVFSPQFHNHRCLRIYFPPSRQENPYKPLPVMVMHDGQNLYEDHQAAFGTAWKIQNTLTPLILNGEITEVVVVGIDNTDKRMYEYSQAFDEEYHSGGGADLYLDFIEKQVLPLVNKMYPNVVTTSNVYLGGSSLGGLVSCYASYTRPKLYRRALCISPAFWWSSEHFRTHVLTQTPPAGIHLYLDSGDSGPSKDGMRETKLVYYELERLGISNTYYVDVGGEHSEYFWGARFHIPLRDLYSPYWRSA